MSGESSVTDLLVLRHVVLALQLPLAMFPLLHFTSSRRWMGDKHKCWFLLLTGWTCCLLITDLGFYGLPDAIKKAWVVIVGH
jgi:manganese transport protein